MKEDFAFLDRAFDLPGPIQEIASFGSGHIHDTFLVTCSDSFCSKFVLQKFNSTVFKKPREVMSNISQVLDQINSTPGSNILAPLHIIKTRNGDLMHKSHHGAFWRIYNFIENSESHDQVTHPDLAYGASRAFAHFFKLISALDPKRLYTTIPDFHHLGIRFQQLRLAIDRDVVGRVDQYRKEVDFAAGREQQVAKSVNLINNSSIPTRVTHNDTKINNVLFRQGTTEGICVLDLDTIMPGLLLYDFGDMGRTFCNNVLEEGNAEEAIFRIDIFKALCEGFFSTIGIPLGRAEVDSLKTGCWWMTYIMGIRFLTDFLSGDVYYKIGYANHNLDRARNQFNLVADIESKQNAIEDILETSYNKFTYS